jgi:hypothetical protein
LTSADTVFSNIFLCWWPHVVQTHQHFRDQTYLLYQDWGMINTPDDEDSQFLKYWYAWTTWNGCQLGVLPNPVTVKASQHVTVVLVCIQKILGFICIAHLF